MAKKILKNIKSKDSKINFKYNKTEIINFCKGNTALSILIALVILFIAIGNSFVVGALLGGYIAAKKSENLNNTTSNSLFIFAISAGAVLGGIILMSLVGIGMFFPPIGAVLGIFVGITAIVAFLGDLIVKITDKLRQASFMNESKKRTKKKTKLHKRTTTSKKKFHLKTT